MDTIPNHITPCSRMHVQGNKAAGVSDGWDKSIASYLLMCLWLSYLIYIITVRSAYASGNSLIVHDM